MSDEQRSEEWQRVKKLFFAALELAPEERTTFLEEACGDDSAFFSEVESLLEEHERGGPVGESLDFSLAEELMGDTDAPEARVGMQIGSWKVVKEIGRGGMGVVYLAERADEEFEQAVALKLIKRGMDSDAILRRFLNERKVLATLRHPNIARLYDGGVTEEGTPWFAMEYVEGVPITDYCTENDLSIDERLALFLNVCRAAQHAHNQLVIHRDLKPSNILVTENGNPWLLDFGLAKVLEDPFGQDPTTRPGHRWVTLEYASPEQIRGEAIGTPSDTYQLGLILYELLVGKRPYTVKGRSPVEAERVICEVDPPRPSIVVGSRGAPLQGQKRQRRLRGDLDTIVEKALHKEAARRYASAENLADDIERHRNGLPIRARPDTLGYRAKKFVKRNRWGIVAASIVLITLLAGMAGTLWQAQRATDNARRVTEERDKAKEVTTFLMNLFEASDPEVAQGDTITARELLERGIEYAGALETRPDLQATLYSVTGRVYQNLGKNGQAEALYRRALAIWDTTGLREENEDERVQTLFNLGDALLHEERFVDAEPFFRRVLERRVSSGKSDVLRRDALFRLFEVYHGLERDEAADGVFQAWTEANEASPAGVDGETAERMIEVAEVLSNRGEIRGDLASIRRGQELATIALPTLRSAYGANHPIVGQSLNKLLRMLGQKEGIEPLSDEDIALADTLSREVVELHRTIYSEPHGQLVMSLLYRSRALRRLGHLDASEETAREAVVMHGRLHDEPSIPLLKHLALLRYDRGEYEGAVELRREVYAYWADTYGGDYLYALTANLNLGWTLTAAGHFQEAEQRLLETYETLEAQRGRSNHYTRDVLRDLVDLYEAWDKPEEAARYRERLEERELE